MISFKAILGFLFGLQVAAVVVLGVLCYQNNDDARLSSFKVRNPRAVIHPADEMASTYSNIYANFGAVLYSNDSTYGPGDKASRADLPAQVKDMVYLTQDNKDRKERIDSLALLLHQLTLKADSTIMINNTTRQNLSDRNKILTKYTGLADFITAKIHRIKQAEEQLLAVRESEHQQSIDRFKSIVTQLLIGIVILLTVAFLTVRYNFNKRMDIQNELRRTNVLFEKVFYESPIAIVVSEYDTDKILNCNKVFASMVNVDVNGLIGKSVAEWGVFENDKQRNEGYIRPHNKEPIFTSLHVHEILLYDRKCLLTAIVDLSTLKRAEDNIKRTLETVIELNELKSRFVTLASHEFRTPLTTISSSAFLLENYLVGVDRAKAGKHLSRIKSAVGGLTIMLDDFLSVTKIEEGKVKANCHRIDIKRYLQEVCNSLQVMAKPGQIIHYTHSGRTDVNTDPMLLGNILNNLVTNSIKYSPENSPIYVLSDVNSKIHLSVRDKGLGIPEADQKHLFDLFYRASNVGNIQGTGLGLHILKHYVQMLEGSLTLESKPGEGTCVQITLGHTS
ncbi:sensor histidine kinase [Ohtaekwangia koreensis]|uniref:histidine kinase n=1 Tax=Ohtaekwangia koreensis TaxID=688867 RepID=A0A1T5M5I0_9BACT|nr:ATP-binding protein [Ohtaekwangia koreensis]SKC83470.1 His Kinase A (phospho-acceptor) domain-containing protein [Ohtaekwangia koreensis]